MHTIPTKIRILFYSFMICLITLAAQADMLPLDDVGIAQADLNAADPRGHEHRIHGYQQFFFTDKTEASKKLSLGEAHFERGYHITRPKTRWTYNLDGKYLSLSGFYGTTRGRPEFRTVSMEIHGDDKLLFRSEPLEKDKTYTLFLDVRGVKTLTFFSVPVKGAKQEDLIIGDPFLTTPPATDTPPEGVKGPNNSNSVPKPVIKANPVEGRAPLTVEFNSESSTDADGKIMRYTWHFGDGGTEPLDFNTEHTYELPGIYELALVAEDDEKGRGVTRQTIIVRPEENMPPRAMFTADRYLVKPGEPIRFDASASRDRDGKLASIAWQFPGRETASGATTEKTFEKMGIYPVLLTVTDMDGASDSFERSVRVDDGSNATVFPIRDGSRILFIGNSLLGGIKVQLPAYAQAAEPPFEIQYASVGKGGGNVQQYVEWDQLKVRLIIMQGWDIVIIQPWGRPRDTNWEETYKPYARTLVEWIRESGAYPVFLEPHINYHVLESGQEEYGNRIRSFAEELDAGYIPGGQAWLKFAQKHPKTEGAKFLKDAKGDDFGLKLMGDGIHQNFMGQMLTTMVIWEYLTGQPATEMKLPEDWGRKDINEKLIPELRETAASVGQPAKPLR